MEKKIKVPGIPHAFFKWYCKKERYEELHGDLEEFFYERAEEKGLFKAQLNYLLNVVRCCQPYAWRMFANPQSQTNSNIGMIKNFYVTAIRNLLKHRRYFLINISGLAIGMASFIFITLYIVNELSYDRFHHNYKNIYRVSNKAFINGQTNYTATTNSPVARTLLNEYPEVVKAARVLESGSLLIGRGNKKINEEGVLFGDSSLFSVFGFELLKGDPRSALVHPKSMILSESYVKKYFGKEDPIGQKMTVEEDTTFYTVTGVFSDIPANSHLRFDMMGSLSTNDHWNSNHWIGPGFHTYIVLNGGAKAAALEEKIQVLVQKYLGAEIERYTGQSMAEWEGSGNSIRYQLVPVQDVHLRSVYSGELEAGSNITYVYLYALIALIILFIALFNFVNLATAQSAARAKEVGVRKVMGSTKTALIWQFLLESLLVSFTAMFLAVFLVILLNPFFVDLTGKQLAFGITTAPALLCVFMLAILVGILAGAYPAFVLSAFKPSEVLKGKFRTGARSDWLRSLFVTMQFAASIVIIIGTAVIYMQIDFMLHKNVGFEKEQVLVIRRPDGLRDNLEIFKRGLLDNPNIRTVANSKTIPGKTYEIRSYRKKEDPETFIFKNNQVAYEYADLMGLELAAGRFFSREFSSDSNAVVINEAAARALGYKDPLGKKLTSPWKAGQLLTIIGVVKDYNISSLHTAVEPVCLELSPANTEGYIGVKLVNGKNVRETVQFIEESWILHAADKPFQYFFFDKDYENLYRTEAATGQVFVVFALLSISISCLGLIGLIAYTASVRKKEMGIRKVLGAGTASLIGLLSGEFVKLILIATLLSWPLAYFTTNYWLQNFADRIPVNPFIYIGSTFAVVLIGSLAVSFQTVKASQRNPVDSLRQD